MTTPTFAAVVLGLLPAIPYSLFGQTVPDSPILTHPPRHVVYALLFKNVISHQEKAKQMDRGGESGAWLRDRFKRDAGLSDTQSDALLAVASAWATDTEGLDRRAREIIHTAKTSRATLKPGETIPPPPPELLMLQNLRDRATLAAITRLETALGQDEFFRFDQYVERKIVPSIKAVVPDIR